MKHTPEPWYVAHHQFIYAENHLLVGQTACPPALSDNPAATQAINADRIAACVNALHDMDNKEIDNIRAWAHGAGIGTALAMKDKAIGEYQLLVSDMEKQRDELQSRVDFLNDQNSAQQEQHDRLAALNAELVATVIKVPTARNPDSVLEQAIGQFEYVVIVGLNKDGDIDFREGGDNKEADLSIPFTLMSKVCHKIMAGDYDA